MFEHIEVAGFRLLDNFAADFQRRNVVIGANASGKSTLVSLMQLITNSASVSLESLISQLGGMYGIKPATDKSMPELIWSVRFGRPAGDFWAALPLAEDKRFRYQVLVEADSQGKPHIGYEGLEYVDVEGERVDLPMLLKSDERGSSLYDATRRELVPFDSMLQQNSGSGDSATPEAPAKSGAVAQPIETLLSRMRFFREHPIQSWVRVALQSAAYYPVFEVGSGSVIRTSFPEIRSESLLSPSGDNLGNVLHELVTRYDYRSTYEELMGFVRAAYPHVEAITAETAFGTPARVLVRFRERGIVRALDLWEASDGMLRFLCLAAALVNPSQVSMIAIDEPEVGLHPRLLPVVADMIRYASDSRQVFVFTHSPDLLSQFDLEDIAVMSRHDSRAKWTRPSDQATLHELLRAGGVQVLRDMHRSGELEAMG